MQSCHVKADSFSIRILRKIGGLVFFSAEVCNFGIYQTCEVFQQMVSQLLTVEHSLGY